MVVVQQGCQAAAGEARVALVGAGIDAGAPYARVMVSRRAGGGKAFLRVGESLMVPGWGTIWLRSVRVSGRRAAAELEWDAGGGGEEHGE
jgi:hypothetical protein